MLKSSMMALFLVAACASTGAAQEGEMPPEMAEYMKYAAPGEHHEHLKAMEGEWTAKSTMWWQPGAPPTEAIGKTTNSFMLGGRYLAQEYEGSMMGQPFKGMGAYGYDNYRQKYVNTWIDSMSTTMMHTEGTCSNDGKQLTLVGEYADPVSKVTRKSRYVITVEGPDKHVFAMYDKGPEGPEHKAMEIVYTRVK